MCGRHLLARADARTVTNEGNTTANYVVNLFQSSAVPAGIKTQVIIHRAYTTPVSDGCTLKYQTQTVVVTNVVNPHLLTGDAANQSLWLEPGGKARITLRVIDPPGRRDQVGIERLEPARNAAPRRDTVLRDRA